MTVHSFNTQYNTKKLLIIFALTSSITNRALDLWFTDCKFGPGQALLRSNSRQLVDTRVVLSPSSIIWYWLNSSDTLAKWQWDWQCTDRLSTWDNRISSGTFTLLHFLQRQYILPMFQYGCNVQGTSTSLIVSIEKAHKSPTCSKYVRNFTALLKNQKTREEMGRLK